MKSYFRYEQYGNDGRCPECNQYLEGSGCPYCGWNDNSEKPQYKYVEISCETCAFWRFIRKEGFLQWKGPHGECKKIDESSFDEKAWNHVFTYPPHTDPYMKSQIFLESSLITAPSFSCNLWKDKDE